MDFCVWAQVGFLKLPGGLCPAQTTLNPVWAGVAPGVGSVPKVTLACLLHPVGFVQIHPPRDADITAAEKEFPCLMDQQKNTTVSRIPLALCKTEACCSAVQSPSSGYQIGSPQESVSCTQQRERESPGVSWQLASFLTGLLGHRLLSGLISFGWGSPNLQHRILHINSEWKSGCFVQPAKNSECEVQMASEKQLHLFKIMGSCAQGKFVPVKTQYKQKSGMRWRKIKALHMDKSGF